MSCCCAGPDFLWRLDQIDVDNTSVRQIKVMLHLLPCVSTSATYYFVPGPKPVPKRISSQGIVLFNAASH